MIIFSGNNWEEVMKKVALFLILTLVLILGACGILEKTSDEWVVNTDGKKVEIPWKVIKHITFIKEMKIPKSLSEDEIGFTDGKGIAFEFRGGMFTTQKTKYDWSFERYVTSKGGIVSNNEPDEPDKETQIEYIDIQKFPDLKNFDVATILNGTSEKKLLLFKNLENKEVLEVYFTVPNEKFNPLTIQAVYKMASTIKY